MQLPIELDRERIAEFCRQNRIRKLALFGSVLRDDFGPESDVDVLVDFEPGQVPSLFRIVDMEMELTEIVGRKVDLRTPEDLSRYFRERVIETAVVQYAA